MSSPIITAAKGAYGVLADSVRSYGRDRTGRIAAALAYRTMFAIAPLLIVATGVFGLIVGDPERARRLVLDVLGRLVGPEVAEAVQALVVSAVATSDTTALIGFVLFAWASSSLFMDLQVGLNDIFGVSQERTAGWRAFLRRRLVAIAWSVSIGILLVTAWLANAAGGWIAGLLPDALGVAKTLILVGGRLVAFAVFPLVFALMYRTMTRARLHRRAVWVGGVVTSLAFVLTALGAGIYFSWDRQTSAGQVAGSVVVLLLASYFLASALLFGAQVTKAYHDRLRRA